MKNKKRTCIKCGKILVENNKTLLCPICKEKAKMAAGGVGALAVGAAGGALKKFGPKIADVAKNHGPEIANTAKTVLPKVANVAIKIIKK